ncbi:GNAT family N-acetyltransferase [Sphingomonas morindae]|uniref:N-acetyltransferase n=1 Tax=Sphingomonas morindae TaxID=1541170 RepID=A0ABY4XCP5_9SPHN|nr:N-acetyltransferase [Sphingomonas morindae]USI74609.1 N-acetyltransferase [Sphingomonas morindae]
MMATNSADAAAIRLEPLVESMAEPVERLLDLTFGYDRHGRTAYRLRERVPAAASLSCAALDGEGRLVGSLQSWPLGLFGAEGAMTPLWLVGPIAVDPMLRNQGIGRAMLRHALAAIDRTPFPAVLIGDPEYYGPFGFSADATGGWAVPGPVERRRLLARLAPGAVLPATGLLGPRR